MCESQAFEVAKQILEGKLPSNYVDGLDEHDTRLVGWATASIEHGGDEFKKSREDK